MRLPVWLYRASTGKVLELVKGKPVSPVEAEETPEDSSTESDEGFSKVRRNGKNATAATRKAKRNGRGR